jgi:hypothetical protein
MKRKTLRFFLLLAILAPWSAKAQQYVTIGNSQSPFSTGLFPVATGWYYSLSQQIYTSDEIGMAGYISSIAFEYIVNESFSIESVQVYMKNVSKSYFESNTDMVSLDGATKVFEGTFTVQGPGWVTIQFDTPFFYDGTSNLLLCCYDPTEGLIQWNSELWFRTTKANSNRSICYYSNEYCPDINDLSNYQGYYGNGDYNISNIQLVIFPNIYFEDQLLEDICLQHWDSNGDNSLSYPEAAQVSSLSLAFNGTGISTFDELQYFTGLATLNRYEFQNCNSLERITVPRSVNLIQPSIFQGCNSLRHITVDPDNPTFDSRDNCNAIIETATNKLVAGCKSTIIPEGVTAIGEGALENLPMSTLTLPSTLQTIESYGIHLIDGLESLTVNAVTPPTITEHFLYGTPRTIPVIVPVESLAAYHNYNNTGQPWGGFTNIIADGNISFVDPAVKAICVANWDTNGDGELSYAEAAAVTTLNPSGLFNGNVFFNNTEITSFNELEYFTGLTSINDYAFYGCNNLTSVTLPHGVTSIGNSAFYNCSGLTSVTIGNSVTSIGDSAFNHCTSLTSVTIGNSVTSIGSYAFGSCSGLTSVTIPDSVTSIGSTAFYNCSGLTSVTIGDSVTSIDSFAFEGCSSLTSVTIPASVTSIGSNPFAYCDLLESITVDPGNTVYSSPNGCNAIIKTADHLLVLGCKNTVIPNDVTTIYGHAFYGCIGLTSIEIPASVSNIYTSAFNRCSNLEEIRVWAVTPPTAFTLCFNYVPTDIPVYVPCNTKTAYQQASGWSVFTNYIDPCANIDFAYEAVKAICVEYFDANQDDELSYSEAAAVLSLGTVFQNAFQDEGTSVSFNELRYFTGLTSIDDDAFSSCWSLTALTLPPSVLTIGEFSFYGCNFSSIVIPNSVTSIGSHAFRSCGALTSITIPSSVTSISENPFFYCPALASITVEAGNTVYSSPQGSNAIIKTEEHKLVSGCKNTVIPEGVTTIGASAFGGCSGLTEIHIPSSVTLIDAWAFMDCSGLITVTIPSSVSFIGNVAFNGCTGLSSITVERETPPTLDNGVFDNTSILVYVPCGSLEAYQNYNNTGTPWGGFTNIHDLCENPLCVAPTNVEVTSTEPQNGYNGFTFSFTPGHEEQTLWSFYVSEDYELPATYQEMVANGWLGSTNQTVGSYYPTNEDELAMEGTTYYLWVGYNCGTEGDPDIVWSEGPTMVTIPSEIVYNLTSGVNWWAPLAPITLGELKSQLYGIPVVINSQNEGFLFGEDNWSGTLSKSDDYIIQPGEMYKIVIKDDSSKDVYVFAVPQTWANVELQHGYNWFGYTGNTKPIADAIGPNSPPTNGDKIIDENGHEATYQDGSWTGDLTHLYKGRGYVYYSAADYTRSLFLQ